MDRGVGMGVYYISEGKLGGLGQNVCMITEQYRYTHIQHTPNKHTHTQTRTHARTNEIPPLHPMHQRHVAPAVGKITQRAPQNGRVALGEGGCVGGWGSGYGGW